MATKLYQNLGHLNAEKLYKISHRNIFDQIPRIGESQTPHSCYDITLTHTSKADYAYLNPFFISILNSLLIKVIFFISKQWRRLLSSWAKEKKIINFLYSCCPLILTTEKKKTILNEGRISGQNIFVSIKVNKPFLKLIKS